MTDQPLATPQPPPPKPIVQWKRVVSNTWFVAIVTNLLTGFFVYYWTSENTDLSYSVSPSRTSIVSVGTNTDLAVTYKTQPIKGDISSVQIEFWNAGRKQIRYSEDVLQPFILTMHGARILEAKVVSTTHPVVDFHLGTVDTKTGEIPTTWPDNRVVLLWNILERNDGAIIQLIYEGDLKVPVELSGVIVNQRRINQRTIVTDNEHKPSSTISLMFGAVFFTALTGVFCTWGVQWFTFITKSRVRGIGAWALAIKISVGIVLLIAALIYFVVHLGNAVLLRPPLSV